MRSRYGLRRRIWDCVSSLAEWPPCSRDNCNKITCIRLRTQSVWREYVRAIHFDSRQSGARWQRYRNHQNARRGDAAFWPLGSAARSQGHCGVDAGPRRIPSKNTSRPCAICARAGFTVATFDWRGQGLSDRAFRNLDKRLTCGISPGLRRRPATPSWSRWYLPVARHRFSRSGHSVGGARSLFAPVTTAAAGSDRVALSAPMIALPGQAVDPHGRTTGALLRILGRGANPDSDRPRCHQARDVSSASCDLRSGALLARHGGARGSA